MTDRWQAFLIDEKVLNEARKWWLVHAAQYRGLPHQPTFHLIRPGRYDHWLPVPPSVASTGSSPAAHEKPTPGGCGLE
ncbi:MAG: hypothetical protein HC898_04035 [Phycisphaerales bacterium]|nr:hypothetical protein [Phycisphaerales bacterium]